MADIESDSEVEFNPRHGEGEGARNSDSPTKQIPCDDGDDDRSDDDRASIRSDIPAVRIPDEPERNNRNYFPRQKDRPIQGRRYSRNAVPQPTSEGETYNDFRQMTQSKVIIKPDKYTGEEDWESYIDQFEACAELGNWGPRVMALTLSACLRGPAKIFYMNLSARQRSSYNQLTSELGRRFGHTRQKSSWISRLETRQRGQGETISSFGDDIQRLTQRAHSNLDSFAVEAIALNQLYKSVSPEMKYRCITADCKTVAKAVEMIELYEGVVEAETTKKRSVVRMTRGDSAEDSPKPIESQLSEVVGSLRQVEKRLDRLERNNTLGAPTKTCYLCRSPNHFRRDCPMNNPRQEYQRNQPGPRNPQARSYNGGKKSSN